MRAVVIHPGQDAQLIEKDWTLKELQAEVGGYIESLPAPLPHISIWGNEEAKYAGEDGGPMPLNEYATEWLKPLLFDGDFIAGPVIVIGYDEATGDNADIPEYVETALLQ